MEKVQAKKRTWRVIDLIKWGEDYFNKHNFEGARQEIEWLLCDLLDCKRIDLYVKFEEIVPQSKLSTLNQWIKKRLNRMPLQYITGKTEFYGNRIFVDQEVLIPRPETERLVDIALEEIKTIVNPKILEIGTGSGCISISIAAHRIDANIIATDISQSALEKAKENSKYHNIKNIEFKLLDIIKEMPEGNYDLVISNPPYIGIEELNSVMKDVKDFEPLIALTDNQDGLSFYRRLSTLGTKLLKKHAAMVLEVGLYDHPVKAVKIFKSNGYKNVNLFKDYNHDNRVLRVKI